MLSKTAYKQQPLCEDVTCCVRHLEEDAAAGHDTQVSDRVQSDGVDSLHVGLYTRSILCSLQIRLL